MSSQTLAPCNPHSTAPRNPLRRLHVLLAGAGGSAGSRHVRAQAVPPHVTSAALGGKDGDAGGDGDGARRLVNMDAQKQIRMGDSLPIVPSVAFIRVHPQAEVRNLCSRGCLSCRLDGKMTSFPMAWIPSDNQIAHIVSLCLILHTFFFVSFCQQ
uniref:Uncharacterized protein n=1 Tax=Oryza sativa subsp. japonica TaxID=39947 RepID=Q84YV7_ORYSJ|nr:hypothetical protein [Oryza sativa Japonica Group]